MRTRPLAVLLAMVSSGGCRGDAGLSSRAAPFVTDLAARANPYNALSVIVAFRAVRGDSARVLYASAAESERATPWQLVRGDLQRIAVLGLREKTSYSLRIQAVGVGGTSSSTGVAITTGEIPAAIRDMHLVVTGSASPGYSLIVPVRFSSDSSVGFLLAFDETGALRWYREFDEGGWGLEAKQQPDGDFTVYLGRSYGFAPYDGRYVEVTPVGDEVRDFRVRAPSYTDPHELLLAFGDNGVEQVHLLGYDLRPFDLSAYGGSSSALLGIHAIERQNATGAVEFRWNAGDHYTPADWPTPITQAQAARDLVHPSSLTIDRDGNYVVSLQAMDEIAKIDAQTGTFIWRLGGRHNQFTFVDDPLDGFQGPHSVRVLEDGHFLLMDNRVRSTPSNARAVEYVLDTVTMVARVVWQYQPSPPVASPIMGSVQRLGSGNTVVGFGYAGRVDEVDQTGAVLAQASLVGTGGTGVQFYRAVKVPSLYRYERP